MISEVEFYYHQKQGDQLEDQEKRDSLRVEKVNTYDVVVDVVIMVITESLENDQYHWSISEIVIESTFMTHIFVYFCNFLYMVKRETNMLSYFVTSL